MYVKLKLLINRLFIRSIYIIRTLKLKLTTVMTPNMNVSTTLLAFVFMRTWTKILQKPRILFVLFTRHENTMIQTCFVAYYNIVVGGSIEYHQYLCFFFLKSNDYEQYWLWKSYWCIHLWWRCLVAAHKASDIQTFKKLYK